MSDDEARILDLAQLLDLPFLRLPVNAVLEVGPASQTLAGIFEVTPRETFTAAENIASEARLPLWTVRKHLVTLNHNGWIHNNGREHTAGGRARRTCTIRLTGKAMKSKERYYPLPLHFCWPDRSSKLHMNWSEKVLLAYILRRLAMLKSITESNPDADSGEGLVDIDQVTGMYRFYLSIDELMVRTGLSRQSVVSAKQSLAEGWPGRPGWGILDRSDAHEDRRGRDALMPSMTFRVKLTPGWVTFIKNYEEAV